MRDRVADFSSRLSELLPGAGGGGVSYDENSIRVLSEEEAAGRFLFARTEELANRYPAVSTRFIERLIEACMTSGWDLDKAARRYCGGDRTIQPPPHFLDCYRAVMPKR